MFNRETIGMGLMRECPCSLLVVQDEMQANETMLKDIIATRPRSDSSALVVEDFYHDYDAIDSNESSSSDEQDSDGQDDDSS